MEVKSGYKQTEVGLIPEDWEVTKIASVTSVKTGPFGSSLHEKDYVQDGTPIITVEHLGEHGVLHQNLPMVSDQDRQRLKAYSLQKGDIVFSRVGSVDRNSLISVEEDGWLFSGRLLRIRSFGNKAHPPFLSYYFHSEPFKQRVRNVAVGQTMPSLNTRIISDIDISLPPLPEQRAIAAMLSDVDSLIASLDALIAKKRLIKQGVMQELLTGKRRLPGFSGEWETKQLADLAVITRGASPRPIDNPLWFDHNSQIGWVRISDVTDEGIYLYQTTQRLSEQGVLHSRPVKKNSLIMSICATVGRPIITKIDTCIHDGFVVFEKLKVDQLFLYYLLSYIEKNWSKSGQTGSQMNLNTGIINRTLISIPRTTKEQNEIAEVIFDIDNEISRIEERRIKVRQIKQGMMQELLTGRTRIV